MHPETFPEASGKTSQGPRIVAIIPARYQSSRLPGKPLAEIGGRPMIEHVYRRTAVLGAETIVATDDERIARAVERFGGVVRMTGSGHRTGTDRIAEVARDLDCDVVVNVQGDLPLLEPAMLIQLVHPLLSDASVTMSTLCRRASADEYANPNVVKVVVDQQWNALYFSRSPLPFFRGRADARHYDGRTVDERSHARPGADRPGIVAAGVSPPVFKHIGLYAFRRDFLLTFAGLPQTPLELAESLEQLRALEHGYRIRTVETLHPTIEVDTPEDLERVRRQLAEPARA